MQVQDLESAENMLRNELARMSNIQTMSQLLGEGPDKLDDFMRKSRGNSEDFQFVNSMGLSAK